MSTLETSVTLEDVFKVVEAKRVPLAPELAGYLTLEIADGTDAGSGNVDPRTVFISEEGTVALVRPKKDSVAGEAEASVRKLLAKLLEASGSGTPALTTAAKRKPGNGLPALVEELEAALIPVNRAAGRRALARLVREVKRVLLGVGRNASAPPVAKEAASKPLGGPRARPLLRKKDKDERASKAPNALAEGVNADVRAKNDKLQGDVATRPRANPFDEEAATVKRTALSELGSNTSSVEATADDAKGESRSTPPPLPVRSGLPPPPKSRSSGPPAPPPPPRRDPTPLPPAPVPDVKPKNGIVAPFFGRDDVDSLLQSFGVSSAHEDKQMARELKAIAGLSPTPPPPDPKTIAELTKDVGKDLPRKLESNADGDSIEALLAMTDTSGPGPATVKARSTLPPVATPGAVAGQPRAASLPPSPIFGPPPSTLAGAVPGAPAALRQSGDVVPPLVPPAREESTSDIPKLEPLRVEPPSIGPTEKPITPPSSPRKPETSGPPSAAVAATTRRTRMSTDRQPRAPRTGMAMLVFALVVLASGTVAIWKFAPQIFTGKKRPPATAIAPTQPVPAPPKCKVALVLTDVPANAEILLRMGQAPVDVERMPVGTRLELVATAEGYAPRRAVIKAESTWDKGPDGKPRIEVPIQLDPSKAKPGTIDPWPAAEPGSQVGGSGAPGTVHVVSNVRGAEVWLLAGLGPEARIEQLRCDTDIDVLFAGPPTLRKRLHVSDKEIGAIPSDEQGNKVVNLSAK